MEGSAESYVRNDEFLNGDPGNSWSFYDGVEWALKKLNKWDLLDINNEDKTGTK